MALRRYSVAWQKDGPCQTTITIGVYEDGESILRAICDALQMHPEACVQVRRIDGEDTYSPKKGRRHA
jgi:hypothetical protein